MNNVSNATIMPKVALSLMADIFPTARLHFEFNGGWLVQAFVWSKESGSMFRVDLVFAPGTVTGTLYLQTGLGQDGFMPAHMVRSFKPTRTNLIGFLSFARTYMPGPEHDRCAWAKLSSSYVEMPTLAKHVFEHDWTPQSSPSFHWSQYERISPESAEIRPVKYKATIVRPGDPNHCQALIVETQSERVVDSTTLEGVRYAIEDSLGANTPVDSIDALFSDPSG